MAESVGALSILGAGAEVTWNTPVIVTQRVPFMNPDAINEVFEHLADMSLEGDPNPRRPDQGMKTIPVTFQTYWRYTLNQLLLTQFFGQRSGVGPFTYTLLNSVQGISCTLALEQEVSVIELAGYKSDQIVITANPTQQFMIEYTGSGGDIDRASATNTSAVLAALTDTDENILFTDMTFRIADTADALAGGDALGIEDLSITIQRNLRMDQHSNQGRTILEQVGNGFFTGALNFTIPRYTANTYKTFQTAHTTLQADITLTDGTNTKTILMPEIKIVDAPPVSGGQELFNVPIQCSLHRRMDNAVMTSVDAMIEITEA